MSVRTGRWALAGAVGIGLVTTLGALQTVGRPFPSLLVDPWADYSVVFLPSWPPPPKEVLAADRLVAIDGVPLARAGDELPARELERAAEQRRQLRLTFSHDGEQHDWTTEPRTFTAQDVWWLFGFYLLLAALFLWAGWLTLEAGVRRAAGWAFSLVSFNAFLFLTTFFDYHTLRRLSPLFAASSFWLLPSILLLALVFPRPPAWARRPAGRRVLTASFGALFAAGLGSGLLTAFALDARPLRLFLNLLLVPMLLALAMAMVVRLFSPDAATRREVRAALWGVVATPLLLALLVFLGTTSGVVWLHLLLPLAGLLVPASIGFAVLRADVFGTAAVVRPSTFAVPLLLLGSVVGGGAAALSEGGARTAGFVGLGWGATAAALLGVIGARVIFPSRVSFRPVIESLAARLGAATSPTAIAHEVEARLAEALPGRSIEVITGASTGQVVDVAWQEPLVTAGGALGCVRVGHREDRSLLTQSDLTLLEVVASVAALALAHLAARAELEERRRLELDVGREDKRLSVDTLAAEVAHELAYPLSYFRHFLGRLQEDHQLPEDDLSIGREEVERLERMLTLVRRFQVGPPHVTDVPLAAHVRRAATLLGEAVGGARQTLVVEVADALRVRADADLLLQLLANLLRNASHAAGPGGQLGVTTQPLDDGRLELVVWDSGPGLSEEVRRRLFTPLFSTRADGSGLGLSICLRIVRSLGWSLDAQRRDARTCFVVTGVEPS